MGLHNSWSTRNVSIHPSLTLEHKWFIFFLHRTWSTSVVSILPSFTLEYEGHVYPSFFHLGARAACVSFFYIPWSASGIIYLSLINLGAQLVYPLFHHSA